jgi:CDGSH-type Zn-finger protein
MRNGVRALPNPLQRQSAHCPLSIVTKFAFSGILRRESMSEHNRSASIQVTTNGPYLVTGALPLAEQFIVTNEQGESVDYRDGRKYSTGAQYALCRCGHSKNKPFCDGSHVQAGFDGTETATHMRYLEQAETFDGPTMSLTDVKGLCAYARFCDPKGRIWNLIRETDKVEARTAVEYEAGHCPAGRLVAWEKLTGDPIEPPFKQSIELIEDTKKGVSGPIWIRGKVPVISADGRVYEIRNRVTLCRCGRSANKPFCDASHVRPA